MEHKINDGGRFKAGFKGFSRRDCVCRSIAIATGLPYVQVREMIVRHAQDERRLIKSGPDSGVHNTTVRKIMAELGWTWVPTMQIGSGCRVHLRDGELPMGRLVVSVSRHITAVIDGVIHDKFDCSRGGTRCVYGYWRKA